MKKLTQVIQSLTASAPHFELSNKDISKASVGWHIAHSYLVITSIVTVLKKSNPADYKWKFSLPHLYVLIRGDFPRGQGKAPERVIPREEINTEVLQRYADQTTEALAELPSLPVNAHFKHPYFGLLNKKATIRFLEIHTKHHGKIIEDIIGKG